MSDKMEIMAWDSVKDDVQKAEKCYWEHYEHEINCNGCELNQPTTKLNKGKLIKGEDTRCKIVFKLYKSWWR